MIKKMKLAVGPWLLMACVLSVGAEEAVQLEALTVQASALTERQGVLLSRKLIGTRGQSVAEAVTAVPGVAAVYRGADAAEPVIRGLGWERVQTQLGCLSLYGACPSRMDPPAGYVSPFAVESVTVEKALPSVTLGHGGTAGRVVINPDHDRGVGAESGVEGDVQVTWDEGRDGYSSSATAQGGTEDLDFRAEAGMASLNDYESGDGKTVPANLEEYTASLSLGYRPGEGQRVFGSVLFKQEEDVDYPALPMDIKESTATMTVFGYRSEQAGQTIERFEVNGGYAFVDHVMNNENKSNRKMMEAETPSEAISYNAKVALDLRAGDGRLLTVGADAEHLDRDATRTRKMMATGMTFKDHIWPEVTRDVYGVFGELNVESSETLTVRVGGRVDFAESEAGATGDKMFFGPGIPPATILDLYEQYNGPDARVSDADDTLFSGNILAEWQAAEPLLVYGGLGRISRYPAVTEQFFAFASAPGGYLIGNPALDSEDKLEATAGAVYTHARSRFELSGFIAQVDDYIYQTALDRVDVNGDGTVDTVRGFRNIDAELLGGEVAMALTLAEGWTLPASLSYVEGRNTTDGRDLPEIPPLGGEAAIRYDASGNLSWWAEAGLRFAATQDRIDETFPEDETAAYQVFHLRAGLALACGLELEAGVENLFDEDYNEHLTREAVLPAGDLAAGDEVPAPGRSFYVTAKVAF